MTTTTLKLVAGALLLATATAIDVKLKNVECEELPITIASDDQFKIICADSGTDVERCSFNGDTAVLSGNFIYSGLNNAGLDGSNAYLTANLEFVSLEYLLAKNQLVDLCDETWITPSSNAAADDGEGRRLEEQNNCDLADGTYAFELPYTLPDYQDNMSWLATGWRGAGYIKLYFDDSSSEENLIGSCTFKFDTMVTKNDAGGMTPPTAAMTLAILAGVFAAGGLLCCYMSFCCGKKNKKKASSSDTTTGGSYKRTEDDGTLMSSKDGSSRGH